MKIISFLIALAFYTISNAQEILPNDTLTDKTSTYLIRLDDNTSLTGKIIERTNAEIIFNDITVGKVTIPVKKIIKFTRLSGDQLCILTTNDGKIFTGLLLAHNDEELILRTESLGDLTISNSKIRDIKLVEKEQIVNGKYYFPNPHPTRYLFGPSAIPLEKGEGYYQNAYLFVNGVQVGITDHFSMGGGVVIPIMFFITPKFGYKVGDYVHIGGGILFGTTLSKDIPFGLGIGYASLTIGTKENNFSLNAGWGALKEEVYSYDSITFAETSTKEWRTSKKPMFSLSGMVRIAPKVALISENWFFATEQEIYNEAWPYDISGYEYKYSSVISFGFRFLGERNSFDFALLLPTIESQTIGLPYIDYVFKF